MSIARIPREERDRLLAEKGLAAKRIVEDEIIQAWFSDERGRAAERMIAAPVSDDQSRRDAALDIQALDRLWRHLETEAGQGMAALKTIEKRKA